MKFLSLRTVYRVFPIIKHCKTLGPRLIPTPGYIDLKKIFCLFVSSRTINMPNFIKIGWEMTEKPLEKICCREKYKKKNKKHNKNRKVFRRCRQTFNNNKNNNKKHNKNRKVFRRSRQTLIKSDLKWCIHLSRSLYLYFNYLVSVTAGGPRSHRGHM